MSGRFKSRVEIAAAPERVFAQLSDFPSHIEWESVQDGAGLVTLEVTSSGPTGIGTRFRSTGKDGSFVMRDESVVTGFEPGHRLRYETKSKAAGAVILWRHSYSVEPIGAATRVDYEVEGTPANLVGWLLWPMVLLSRSKSTRLIATTLQRLKQRCEARTGPAAAAIGVPARSTS